MSSQKRYYPGFSWKLVEPNVAELPLTRNFSVRGNSNQSVLLVGLDVPEFYGFYYHVDRSPFVSTLNVIQYDAIRLLRYRASLISLLESKRST